MYWSEIEIHLLYLIFMLVKKILFLKSIIHDTVKVKEHL